MNLKHTAVCAVSMLFLPLAWLFAQEKEIVHTIRCNDGAVLLVGTKSAVQESQKALLEFHAEPTIKNVKQFLTERNITGVKEVKSYYDPSVLSPASFSTAVFSLKEAQDKAMMPYVQGLSILEARKLLSAFGYYVVLPAAPVGRTGIYLGVELVAQSAGIYSGDYARLMVNGVDVSPNQRGYNVAVVDPETWKVTETGAFDTWLSEGETARLADFVKKVPSGWLVMMAVKDEASKKLNSVAVSAIRSVGGSVDMRGHKHFSHALIGVKDAPEGSALEKMGNYALEVMAYPGLVKEDESELLDIAKKRGNTVFLSGTTPEDRITFVLLK